MSVMKTASKRPTKNGGDGQTREERHDLFPGLDASCRETYLAQRVRIIVYSKDVKKMGLCL